MAYTLPDTTKISFHVLWGRREDTSADVYDNATYDNSSYDGGSQVGFKQLPESVILSMAVKAGKDRFGKRYRAGALTMIVDNSTGGATAVDSPLSPGDYLWVRATVQPPAGPPDVPIPDGWTWNDETTRQWTAHGSLIWSDDTPDRPTLYPTFYGRIDNSTSTVRGGKDVTKLRAYDVFAELAPVEKDALPAQGAGETSFARIDRIAGNATSAVAIPSLTVGVAEATMQATTLAQGALDMMHLTMDSEGGDLIGSNEPFGATGKAQVIAYGRDWLTTQPRSTNIQWTLGGQGNILTDAQVSKEQQLLVNDATFANVGGVAQNNTNSDSIQRYGVRTTRRLDLIAEDDTQAQYLAARFVTNLAFDRPRIRQATVPVVDAASALFAADVRFGDLVLTTMQSVNGWAYTALGHVIGKQQRIFDKQWIMVLTLSDAFVDNVNGAYDDEEFSNAFTLGHEGG